MTHNTGLFFPLEHKPFSESTTSESGGAERRRPTKAAPPNHREQLDKDMALLMEPGSEPLTEDEKADLEGIAAIKESAAREYKEQGNQFVKMGRKHYADAVDCYTKAITQMGSPSAPNPDASVLFANRSHVNLLLGNHRRALDDAEQAVRLSPSNVKVRDPSLDSRIWCRSPLVMSDVRVARRSTGRRRPRLLSTCCRRRSPSPGGDSSWTPLTRSSRNFSRKCRRRSSSRSVKGPRLNRPSTQQRSLLFQIGSSALPIAVCVID
jgi:tetratricopeptide (TPR) repeat protein